MSISNVGKAKIFLISVVILLGVLVTCYYFLNIDTGLTKSKILSSIFNLHSDSIEYVTFYDINPKNFWSKDSVLYISDNESIKQLTHELVKIEKFSPNHPEIQWSLKAMIKFRNKIQDNFFLKIVKSDSINGTCIWIMKKSQWGDFNLGEYRNDNLSNIIEDVINKIE